MSRNFEVLRAAAVAQEFFPAAAEEVPVAESRRSKEHRAEVRLASTTPGRGKEVLKLVHRLFLSGGNGCPRGVLFCGVDERSASTEVCARVAEVLAEETRSRVCVVDVNPNGRSIRSLLNVDVVAYAGTASSDLVGQPLRSTVCVVEENFLLPDRRVEPDRDVLRGRMDVLRRDFEYLLIDAPNIASGSEAAVWGQAADGAVLVLEAHLTRRVAARKAKEVLEDANVRLLGIVLNNRTFPIPAAIYHRL